MLYFLDQVLLPITLKLARAYVANRPRRVAHTLANKLAPESVLLHLLETNFNFPP